MTFAAWIAGLADRVVQTRNPGPPRGVTGEDALRILNSPGEDLPNLLDAAARVRETFCGGAVTFCAIVNARSGRCSQDCSFCAQSVHYETGAADFPMIGTGEIRDAAMRARADGARRFSIVTSGVDPGRAGDMARLVEGVRAVADVDGLRACLSCGVATADELAAFKGAGLKRYHHNIETARSFYPSVCTTRGYDDNAAAVKRAKAAGLEVCCGGIFGMGESAEQRVEMIREWADLEVDAVPINFLNPIPGTPLEGRPPVTPNEALRIIAAVRMSLPDRHILLAGGREAALGDRQVDVFNAGANGLMVGDYLTTAGRPAAEDLAMARDQGLTIDES